MDELRCQYCSRDFLKRDHLFRHERVHTKEKPFSCPTCHARFSRKDVLKRHERSHARSSARSTQTDSVNNDASDCSPNHQVPDQPASRQTGDVPALLGLPLEQSTPSEPIPQASLEEQLWNNTLMTDIPTAMDTTLDEISDTSFPSSLAPANPHAAFDVNLEAWAILNGVFTTSASPSFPIQSSASGHSTIPSSFGLWDDTQRTPASGPFEKGSVTGGSSRKKSKKDRRICFIEAMYKAWPTRWSMSDFKMSMDMVKPAEEGNLAADMSTLKVYENLTAPMVFDHSLSPNLRFLNMCFKLYVKSFWARFPIVHLPSLAPSWENNHLLFFSMCTIGSAFAGSRDALEFGNRLHERIGFLIMSKWKSIMASNSSSTNQLVLILLQINLNFRALLLGDSDLLARTVTHWGSVVLWARRAGILQDFVHSQSSQTLHQTMLQDLPTSELYCRWRDWIDEEMKLRVAYAVAIIDAELSSVFFQPPMVNFRLEGVRALASDALFAAQTAEEWRDIARMEAERNSEMTGSRSGSISNIFTHPDGDQNPRTGKRLAEMGKHHRLEKIFGIAAIATEISVHRSGLFNEAEISLQQDNFLRRLLDYLPPLFTNHGLSPENSALRAIISDNSESISEENLEANILWHSTFISLYVDRYALERYHGSEGIQTAQSTLISLSPAVVVALILHCLVIRCLAEKYSQGRYHLPIFVFRGVLLASMALNWYQDQKSALFGNQKNTAEEEMGGMGSIDATRSMSSPLRLEDWVSKLNSKDPFSILIQNQSTREKLQRMLDGEDVIFSMATALRQSSNAQGKYRSFAQCLEILANYEMGLVV